VQQPSPPQEVERVSRVVDQIDAAVLRRERETERRLGGPSAGSTVPRSLPAVS